MRHLTTVWGALKEASQVFINMTALILLIGLWVVCLIGWGAEFYFLVKDAF